MQVEISKLMNCYIENPVCFKDAFKYRVEPLSKTIGAATMASYCGFVFPLKGKARFTFENKFYDLEPGIVLHAGPSMPISKEVIGNSSWEFVLVHYDIKVIEEDSFLKNKHFILEIGKSGILYDLLNELCECYLRPDKPAKLRSKALFLRVLEEMMGAANHKKNTDKKEYIQEAVQFIHDNYRQQLSVFELAEEFNMEVRKFAYLFQKSTGMSPQNYITAYRMNKAKERLRTSEETVIEVALHVGYSDPFYFSKLFKKYIGMPPSRYKKKFAESTW
jgi:AraC-like DNA-binding protein